MVGAGPYPEGIVYNNRGVCTHRYQQLGRSVELKYNSYPQQRFLLTGIQPGGRVFEKRQLEVPAMYAR